MSNSEHTTAHAVTPGDDSRLTVEDTGSTTDASDLARDDADRVTTTSTSDTSTTSGGTEGNRNRLGDMPDDGSIGHVFDQTNGVVEGVEGDSDGTAESDVLSGAERGEGAGRLDGAEPLGGDANGTLRRDPND
jgi:hypothetical protein